MLWGDVYHTVGVFTHPHGYSRTWLLSLLSEQTGSADLSSWLPGMRTAACVARAGVWEWHAHSSLRGWCRCLGMRGALFVFPSLIFARVSELGFG